MDWRGLFVGHTVSPAKTDELIEMVFAWAETRVGYRNDYEMGCMLAPHGKYD